MSNNFYEVKRGDTLWGICKREFNLTSNSEIAKKVAEISKNNSIFDGQIEIGQKINLDFEKEEKEIEYTRPSERYTSPKDTIGFKNEPKKEEKDISTQSETPQQKETSETASVIQNGLEKQPFVRFVEECWTHLIWSPKSEGDKNISQTNLVTALPEGQKTEEVIPEGHTKAPNGKITKIYSKKEIEQIIEDSCRKHRVDSSLVRAIISVESSNNQFAESKVGAQGLMQLMPEGAGKGLENAYDAKTNIERGVQEFARLKRFYGNNVDALRAYNYGEGRYNQYLSGERTVLPKETVDYPEKVLSRYQRYSRAV